ncbi:hypothetical protein OPW39_15490 [Vibrio europaeus]|uniref:hypothetical protein n=1 Tax=Vibrio europaeus TaxID=300876 RepID=UPI00233E5DA0|nr:hypothetical protein [Vibrio europaeus]MDC5870210.1 hypothetical protein [Vibrio europaeus]
MLLKPNVWAEAVKFRCHLASEYRKFHAESDAKAAKDLTELAVNLNLTKREKPIHGATLAGYVLEDSPMPYWAAMAALVYIISEGYQPINDDHLDYIVAHIAKDRDETEAMATAIALLGKVESRTIKQSIKRIAD